MPGDRVVQITTVNPPTIDAVGEEITIGGTNLGEINYIKLKPQSGGSAISVYYLEVDEEDTSCTFSAPDGLTAGRWNVVGVTSGDPAVAPQALTFAGAPPVVQPTPQQQCQQAYQQLLADPAGFLGQNPIILRSQTVLTGERTLYMSISMHNNNQTTVFEINTSEQNPGCSFQGFCIGVTAFSDLSSPPPPNDLPAYPLPSGDEPLLLVTPVLTGCCMVTQPLDGDGQPGPFVAHISPDSGNGHTTSDLQNALQGSFFQGSQVATGQYGANDYLSEATPRATFLGVRIGGRWTTYQQHQAQNYTVTQPVGSTPLF